MADDIISVSLSQLNKDGMGQLSLSTVVASAGGNANYANEYSLYNGKSQYVVKYTSTGKSSDAELVILPYVGYVIGYAQIWPETYGYGFYDHAFDRKQKYFTEVSAYGPMGLVKINEIVTGMDREHADIQKDKIGYVAVINGGAYASVDDTSRYSHLLLSVVTLENFIEANGDMTVSEIVDVLNLTNDDILEFKKTSKVNKTDNSNKEDKDSNKTNKSNEGASDTSKNTNYEYYSLGGVSSYNSPFNNVKLSLPDCCSGCYFKIYYNNTEVLSMNLPTLPQDITDSVNGSFNSIPIPNRSVEYQVYQQSGRSVSFDLKLHEDMILQRNPSMSQRDAYDYIHYIVSAIQSSCYPLYQNGFTVAPEIAFKLGDQFYIRGVVSDASAQWSAPIIDGNLVYCTMNISVAETFGPYTGKQIFNARGNHAYSPTNDAYEVDLPTNYYGSEYKQTYLKIDDNEKNRITNGYSGGWKNMVKK